MIRHIFIARFKDGITQEVKDKELVDLRAMKEKIPGVVAQQVGLSKGWVGVAQLVVMTVDFILKEDFDAYMIHPYHADYINQTGIDFFDVDSFVVTQLEF
jgi:hypothetical protein